MIPIPDKILGSCRNSIGHRLKRICNAKSGYYSLFMHREHVLGRTGYYLNMQDRNRYPTGASRKDLFKSSIKFYREFGEWFF
jgi:hypothetical protein